MRCKQAEGPGPYGKGAESTSTPCGPKQRSHLRNPRSVGAVALADQQSGGIEPHHVAGFSFSRRLNLTQHRHAKAAAEFHMTLRFRNSVRLAGMQADEAVIGRQRGIVGVDSVERKIGSRRQMEYLGSGGFELAAKFVMLRLRGREIRRVEEAQLLPMVCHGRLVPSRSAWRAHQHALQSSHHGMTIESLGIEDRICNSPEVFKDCDRLPVLQSKQVL